MSRWPRALGSLVVVLSGLLPLSAAADDQGDSMLRHSREVWRQRTEAPYVIYGVRTQYELAGRLLQTWYSVTYRASDGALALERIPMDGDAAHHSGTVFSIFGLPVYDTNPNAEVFALLREPAVEPAFTFGFMPSGYHSPVNQPVDDPTPDPFGGQLREIGRVVAINRDYRVTNEGIEHLRDGDAYHLALEPVRDPEVNRLRDVWVAKDTYQMMQETVAGILDSRPYNGARWTITFVPVAGRMYLQQVRTDELMRFGERKVANFRIDFVDYRFPQTLPPHAFDHWL